jgi:four helix bundle protein
MQMPDPFIRAVRAYIAPLAHWLAPCILVGMSRDHRKLDVFNLADELTLRVYAKTQSFDKTEIYGLRSQIRRAAVSIPTNIVEGCGRDSEGDLLRFLDIAFASTRELNYLVDLSSRLHFLDTKTAKELVDYGGRVAAALAALRKSYS